MSRSRHTHLPWSAHLVYEDMDQKGPRYFEISGTNSIYWIAKVMYEFKSGPSSHEELATNQANAELIITAVNHHQELITRLYNLKNAIEVKDQALIDLYLYDANKTLSKLIL